MTQDELVRDAGSGEPDRERLFARLQAQLSKVPRPVWSVWGLAGRDDEILAGAGWSADTIEHVELGYGEHAGAPSVTVDTRPLDAHLSSLEEVLDLHWANRRDVDYPVDGPLPEGGFFGRGLPGAPRAHPVRVTTVEGELIGQQQDVEDVTILRFATGGVVVTTVADQWNEPLAFRLVSDLTAATRARERWLAELRAKMLAAGPVLEPPPLTGPDGTEPLWAHKGLAEMLTGPQGVAAEGESARRHRRQPADYGQRWEAAERRQQEMRDQSPADAADHVQGMANLLQALKKEPWWSDDELRRQAIAEIVWVTATGEDNVGSADAQRAWRDYWGHPRGGVFVKTRVVITGSTASRPRATPRPLMEWQRAWRAWAAGRTHLPPNA